jgi:spermidine/putrescine-binding protein
MANSDKPKISRRRFVKRAAAATAAITAAPMIAKGLTRQAKASGHKPGTIRLLGGASTMIPGDWTQFEKDTGLKMELTLLKDDPGVFFNDVMVNDAGSRYDIIAMLAGVQGPLVEGDWIIPIDHSRIPNWAGVEPGVKNNPQLSGMTTDTLWGVPIYMNADTFGYFPEKLSEPRPPEEVSWSLVFDDEKTLGQSAVGDNFYTLTFAAAYMKYHKLATIDKVENMTASEVASVADWMIERKKAGQFRTYWSTFDDQISNFVNGETLAQVCWEPAVKESRKQGADIEYAWTPEFYIKWMTSGFIPVQAQDHGNLDEIYRAFDWFCGGAYGALLGPLRGYATPRPDLALDWAKERDYSAEDIKAISDNLDKLKYKYAQPEFWFRAVPDTLAEHEREMARFLNT